MIGNNLIPHLIKLWSVWTDLWWMYILKPWVSCFHFKKICECILMKNAHSLLGIELNISYFHVLKLFINLLFFHLHLFYINVLLKWVFTLIYVLQNIFISNYVYNLRLLKIQAHCFFRYYWIVALTHGF